MELWVGGSKTADPIGQISVAAEPASEQLRWKMKNLIERSTTSSPQRPDHEATKAGVEQERTQHSFRSTS